MRVRPSSRLILVDPDGCVLLFHFVFKRGALAGVEFWKTPGGRREDGETFEEAAIRELREETGIEVADVGPQVFRSEYVMQTMTGEPLAADERFFRVDVSARAFSREGWTDLENEILAEHRWWSPQELEATAATIHPPELLDLLRRTRKA